MVHSFHNCAATTAIVIHSPFHQELLDMKRAALESANDADEAPQ